MRHADGAQDPALRIAQEDTAGRTRGGGPVAASAMPRIPWNQTGLASARLARRAVGVPEAMAVKSVA